MHDHPYRHAAPGPQVDAVDASHPEALIGYGLMVMLGSVRLALAFAVGETLGVEAIVAAGFVVAGIASALAEQARQS